MRRALLVLVGSLLVAACGDAAPPRAAAGPFPRPPGKLVDLLRAHPAGPVLAPTVSRVRSGPSARIAFGLLDAGGAPIDPPGAALYLGRADGSGMRGPVPVTREDLAVRPPFRSKTSSQDPDAARAVWVAHARVRRGTRRLVAVALVRSGDRLVRTNPMTLRVDPPGGPPPVGARAARVHTETLADARGDLGRVDTRVPPWPALHREDLARVLGRRPVLLLFATPQLCQSRVCGPVVDVAAEVQSRFGDRVAFIHQEIYRDNQVRLGHRSAVRAWRLPTEPWAFAIDRRGRIRAELEGAFSVAELERAVRAAL